MAGKTGKQKKEELKKEEQRREENQVFISEADQYLFAQGTHYDIYKKQIGRAHV